MCRECECRWKPTESPYSQMSERWGRARSQRRNGSSGNNSCSALPGRQRIIVSDTRASVARVSDDLFSATDDREPGDATTAPLAVRMRPRSVDEVRGQGDAL